MPGLLANRAYADDELGDTPTEVPADGAASNLVSKGDVHGIDFMTTTAEDGLWDLFRVENGAGKNIYIEISQNGAIIAPRFVYQIADDQDIDAEREATDYAGADSSARIAQIVALKIAQVDAAAQGAAADEAAPSLQDVFADPNAFPSYTITVYDAKRQGNQLYQGTVCPVYARLVSSDGAEEWKVLGIRTIDPETDAFAETVGAGASYYKNLTGETPIVYQCTDATDAGEPKAVVEEANEAHGKRLVVTYEQVDAAAISGAVKYVDVDGNIIDTELVENLGQGKAVAIRKSFFKTTIDPETNEEVTRYYRVIQRLNGSTVLLTPEQATKQVRVMEVKNTDAGAYQVTIKYVDDNGNTLWTDAVDVKGQGYQYTLPNSFSMSAVAAGNAGAATDRSQGHWGINYYTLDSWTIETNAGDDNEALAAQSVETQQGNPVIAFSAGEYPAGRTVTAVYASQATTKKVNLTVMEINGATGALIDKIQYEVTPDRPATYTPARKDGGLVPWSGNMEPITYAWEDLEKGTDVLQYVYYVPEDYTAGDTYDITVQYMNIANSQILRSETITIDPETNDFVNILGEERFSLGDDTYVRLAGQETAIRHAYFSPARTYTIYYRDVNDELSAQITIRRTQIVDTERVVTVPGTTVMTAAPVLAAAPAAEGEAAADATAPAAIDAGVGTGDAATVINDDDNPLTNMAGQDTTTERTIVDDENPLYSGLVQDVETSGSGTALYVASGAIVLLAAGLALYWWTRRRKKSEPAVNDSTNA